MSSPSLVEESISRVLSPPLVSSSLATTKSRIGASPATNPTPSSSVSVVVRVRPLVPKERLEKCVECVRIHSKQQLGIGKNRLFSFDRVYEPNSLQMTLYAESVRSLLYSIFEGYNATVFAYGQTGSGKTYTMGTSNMDSFDGDHVGMIPRIIREMFRMIESRKDVAEFMVRVSYLEIYNEEFRDLLLPATPSKNIAIREDGHGGIVISGAKEEVVTTADDMMSCLQRGALARTTGRTLMNELSSRSHAIFTIILEQRMLQDDEPISQDVSVNNEYLLSKFHLVDLAGSERNKRTGAIGDRFKESVNINAGLLALSKVISALSDMERRGDGGAHVPYRESKLTRMLQDSLGGNSRTLMIACISPADINFEETLNTLKYANRAKNIKNKPVINRDPHSAQLAALRNQIQILQIELLKHRLVAESGTMLQSMDGEYSLDDLLKDDANRAYLESLQGMILSNSSPLSPSKRPSTSIPPRSALSSSFSAGSDLMMREVSLAREQAQLAIREKDKIAVEFELLENYANELSEELCRAESDVRHYATRLNETESLCTQISDDLGSIFSQLNTSSIERLMPMLHSSRDSLVHFAESLRQDMSKNSGWTFSMPNRPSVQASKSQATREYIEKLESELSRVAEEAKKLKTALASIESPDHSQSARRSMDVQSSLYSVEESGSRKLEEPSVRTTHLEGLLKTREDELSVARDDLKRDEQIFAEKYREIKKLKVSLREAESRAQESSSQLSDAKAYIDMLEEHVDYLQSHLEELRLESSGNTDRPSTPSTDVSVLESITPASLVKPLERPRTTPTCSPGLVPSDQRYQASQQSVSDFYQAVPSSRFPSVSRLDESDSVIYPSMSETGLPSSSQGKRPVGLNTNIVGKDALSASLVPPPLLHSQDDPHLSKNSSTQDPVAVSRSDADALRREQLLIDGRRSLLETQTEVLAKEHALKQRAMADELQTLAEQIQRKEALIQDLVDRERSALHTLAEYEARITDMEENLAVTREELDRALREVEASNEEQVKKDKEKERLRRKYEQDLRDRESELEDLRSRQSEYQRLAKAKAESDRRLKDQRSEVDKLKSQQDLLRRRIREETSKHEETINQLNSEISTLKKESELAVKRIRSLEAENRRQKMALRKKNREIVTVQRRLRSASRSRMHDGSSVKGPEEVDDDDSQLSCAEEINSLDATNWIEREVDRYLRSKEKMERLQRELHQRERILLEKEEALQKRSTLLRKSQKQIENEAKSNSRKSELQSAKKKGDVSSIKRGKPTSSGREKMTHVPSVDESETTIEDISSQISSIEKVLEEKSRVLEKEVDYDLTKPTVFPKGSPETQSDVIVIDKSQFVADIRAQIEKLEEQKSQALGHLQKLHEKTSRTPPNSSALGEVIPERRVDEDATDIVNLSDGEDEELRDLDEYIEILDAEIEYKNEGIRRLEEELDAVTESTSGNPSARVTDNLPHPPNLLPYLEHVTLPEAQSLLRKYFEKVIELRNMEKQKEDRINTLELELSESQSQYSQLENALRVTEAESGKQRRRLEQDMESRMSILVQELDARKSRIASLESQISQIQSELARSSVPESGSGHSRDESSDVNRKEADPINFDRHVLEQNLRSKSQEVESLMKDNFYYKNRHRDFKTKIKELMRDRDQVRTQLAALATENENLKGYIREMKGSETVRLSARGLRKLTDEEVSLRRSLRDSSLSSPRTGGVSVRQSEESIPGSHGSNAFSPAAVESNELLSPRRKDIVIALDSNTPPSGSRRLSSSSSIRVHSPSASSVLSGSRLLQDMESKQKPSNPSSAAQSSVPVFTTYDIRSGANVSASSSNISNILGNTPLDSRVRNHSSSKGMGDSFSSSHAYRARDENSNSRSSSNHFIGGRRTSFSHDHPSSMDPYVNSSSVDNRQTKFISESGPPSRSSEVRSRSTQRTRYAFDPPVTESHHSKPEKDDRLWSFHHGGDDDIVIIDTAPQTPRD